MIIVCSYCLPLKELRMSEQTKCENRGHSCTMFSIESEMDSAN